MVRKSCAAVVAGLVAVAVLAVPASATPGVHGTGVYCPRYDAYELRDCRPDHRLPPGALGQQLAWVFWQLGGGAATLTVEEIKAHLTAELQALIPAEDLLEAFRATLAEVGPVRFVGFTYPPRADQAMALGQTTSGQRIAVALGISGALIDQLLGTMSVPPTLVPRGPYNGWYDVGGRRLFLRCVGSGSPTVVFDQGLTDYWYPVQQSLSRLTRVCSYDPARQAGPEGRSDPASTPRTGIDRVNDLRNLLAAARVPGLYVLAVFSNGGLFDLLYASLYPQQVAGLVLVDAVHPDRSRRVIEAIKPLIPPEQWPDLAAAICAIRLPVQLDYEQVDHCTAEAQTRPRRRCGRNCRQNWQRWCQARTRDSRQQ